MTPLRLLPLAAFLLSAPASAEVQDPAAQRITRYFAEVEAIMKQGKALGMKGRVERFEPVVREYFDMDRALSLVAGPAALNAPPADRLQATTALSTNNAVRHATNFADSDGEKFAVDASVQSRAADKLVRARILSKAGTTAATLVYRLRVGGDQKWRILDVTSDGVSQLALQRADFAAALQSGGLPGLTKRLNQLNTKALSAK